MQETDICLATRGGRRMLEGRSGTRLLEVPEDAAQIVSACFEQGTGSVLLYAENLTRDFFDLSSGEAGAILQKLRNYNIRLAVVVRPEGSIQSSRFREMVAEESEGQAFRIFGDRTAAEEWLLGEQRDVAPSTEA